MYKIELTNKSILDISDIQDYIRYSLNNNTAAEKLLNSLLEKIENIAIFPYSNAIYSDINNKRIKSECRTCKVDNYLIVYTIIEKENKIIILRVVYQKRNLLQIVV